MKYVTAIAIVLALGCSASEEQQQLEGNAGSSSMSDIGTVQEALQYPCKISLNHQYGLNANNFTMSQCLSSDSSELCAFPAPLSAFPMGGIRLGTGWTAADKQVIQSPGLAAANFFTSNFGCEDEQGTGLRFSFNTTATSGSYGVLNKGTIGVGANAAFDTADAAIFMNMGCTSATTAQELEPMSAVLCSHWQATIDWAKLSTWAQSNGHTFANLQIAAQNLFQHAFGQLQGLGTHITSGGCISSGCNVMDFEISRTQLQTTWQNQGGGEKSWVCNAYLHNGTGFNLFVCD